MTDVEDFGAELTDFRRRVDELRSARARPQGEHLPTLDAALCELRRASEVLWPRYRELADARRHSGTPEALHEQRVLGALFERLPVAVALLDRDGAVRRLNAAAAQLFGMRAGYAAGRPLAGSLTEDGRSVFDAQVAAVARDEGARCLRVHLPRTLGAEDPAQGPGTAAAPPDGPDARDALRVTLTSLRPPREPHTGVLALFQPALDGTAGAGVPALEPVEPHIDAPCLGEMARHAELLDLVDDMAAELLTARAAPEAVAARAAALLHERFADWVILDTGDEDGLLRRTVVLAPDGAVRDALMDQDPAEAPVVREAVERGAGTLESRPEDPEAFGRDATGAQVLVRAGVGSLICVPLSADGTGVPATDHGPDTAAVPGAPRGALTLFRTGDKPAFELAEAGAVDRMARHIALALGAV